MLKPSELLDHPNAGKVCSAVLVLVVSLAGWAGKTLMDSVQATWSAQERIEAIKADVLKSANTFTTEKLAGYVSDREFLRWQLRFEQQERQRDREKLEDLKRLLQAQGRR